MICTACKQECSGYWHDFGVGYDDAWGKPIIHKDLRYVSDCCEAEVELQDGEDSD